LKTLRFAYREFAEAFFFDEQQGAVTVLWTEGRGGLTAILEEAPALSS
jgi:hypothetical protein